jgi:CPA2 family monovalent cation:H+ antiporter-2
MKNVLMAMFFISVGMEITLQSLADNVLLIVILYLIFAVLKSSTVFLGYWLGNESPRNGFVSAVSLVAMGEFAFIIAKQALDYGVVGEGFYTSVIGAALLSMIMLPLLTKSSMEVWDKATASCPAGLSNVFRRINGARDSTYSSISSSSRRTKKEFTRLMTLNYVCVLLVILVEIAFVLINPAFAEWLAKFIGGTVLLWSILMLLANLILIYFPIHMIVDNIRTARALSNPASGANLPGERITPTIADMFRMSSTTMLSMMIAIVVLVLVPNNIGIWEHIAVMILVLAGLFYYNRKSIQKMFGPGPAVPGGEGVQQDVGIQQPPAGQEERTTVVSIDPKDRDKGSE